MGNPFVEDLNDTFRGTRVRVVADARTYEGYAGRVDYDDHSLFLYNAERDDGEQLGAVLLSEPTTVERLTPMAPIEEISVGKIAPSPYSTRSMADDAHQQFIKQTRERGHLLTYPTVRPVAAADHEYEVVSGHRRFDTAQQARLDTIAVRIAALDAWEAIERFVDEHVPYGNDNNQYMYTQSEIDETIARLREDWPIEKLRELTPLGPYLRRALSHTRREGIRQGYVTDGH